MMRFIEKGGGGQRGSALIYILIAIALLALLTVSFMQPASQQTQSQNTFKMVSDLQSQIDFIRATVQECVALHYKGDARRPASCIAAYVSGIPNCPGEEDEGANHRYPIKPNSLYFDNNGVDPNGIADRLVRNLRCPGNPSGNPNHAAIFSAASGKFMPSPPDLFEEWQWYNGDDGVFFWIQTNKSDAFIQSALQKLDEKFSECEADIIDTSFPAAGDKDLDSNADVACPNGYTCFRVWMIANASNIYPGDADGDEAACP